MIIIDLELNKNEPNHFDKYTHIFIYFLMAPVFTIKRDKIKRYLIISQM